MISLDEVNPQGVARRMRAQMQAHDLTVVRAAKACHLPQPTFETYLYGQHLPGAKALVLLAEGLRCTSDYLLTGKVQS